MFVGGLGGPEGLCLAFNTRFANKTAGWVSKGYLTIKIKYKSIRYQAQAQRFIWAIMTGDWPKSRVDHENTVRLDNKWTNLRLATASQNAANAGTRVNNTSGVKGVSWDKCCKKWFAKITVDGKQIYLGVFETLDGAASAYKEAAERHFGEFART
jgi:hypothetical protein